MSGYLYISGMWIFLNGRTRISEISDDDEEEEKTEDRGKQ